MSPLALVSVSDKKNIIPFCKELVERFNYKILSSGGTAKHLMEAKIPVIKVADFTNSPEILGGRVKTLHPKIHGGILAKRSDKEHKKDIETNNLELIEFLNRTRLKLIEQSLGLLTLFLIYPQLKYFEFYFLLLLPS